MAGVLGFFRWVWRKVTFLVLFWRRRAKQTVMQHSESKKPVKGVEKTHKMPEPSKGAEAKALREVETLKGTKTLNLDESSNMTDSCVSTKTTEGTQEGTQEELGQGGRSLLQLPRSAVHSVSTLMVSALQSGWQMCTWKSMSSASIPSQMKTGSPLESPEAEMLREVYLVLWAIQKQLRQLVHRQDRRRRYRIRHVGPQPESVQGPKQDARSPL